jgi:hypothetical protein
MTELHSGLVAYRGQLRTAIDRSHKTRRTRAWVAAPALGVAALAAAAVLAAGVGTNPPSADAAILRATLAALTPPPGTIIHEKAMVSIPGQSAQPYELWQESDPPYAYHVIKRGHEASSAGSDSQQAVDLAATLRSLVQNGGATVVGTATIDGVPAYQLAVSGSDQRFVNGTAYVAQSDYRPLSMQTTTDDETITFETYEYLPATSANLALLTP